MVPAHLLPLSLEIIVQPGFWAVVLLHVPSRDGFPIPIGYATRNAQVVALIGRTLSGIVARLSEASVAWAAHHTEPRSVLRDLERAFEV